MDEPLLFGATKASRKRSRRGFYKSFVILVDRFGWVLLMVVAAFMLLNRYLRPLVSAGHPIQFIPRSRQKVSYFYGALFS